MRDYGLPSSVWGGNADCEHEWGETLPKRTQTTPSARGGRFGDGQGVNRSEIETDHITVDVPSGQFCQLCGAWRGSLGLEPTPELYVEHLVEIFREVKRVLHPSGTVWCNLGDSYATGSKGTADGMTPQDWTENGKLKKGGMTRAGCPDGLKPKDLCGIPWRVAFALQADGWWLRSDIIWHKPNCMPESVTDRPTKSHEYVFLLTKSARYFYDADAIREKQDEPTRRAASFRDGGVYTRNRSYDNSASKEKTTHGDGEMGTGRNRRTVWTVPTQPYSGAHFAVFPPALVEPMIKAGTSERGCCPACGSPWERVHESTGHVNKREPAHAPFSEPTKTDSTGWAPTTTATNEWRPTCSCNADYLYGIDRQGRNVFDDADIMALREVEKIEGCRIAPVPCTVLDPFAGAGTVGLVADRLQRDAILIELNPEYAEMARRRIEGEAPMFASVAVERVCK